MHHCPSCGSRAITVDKDAEGVRIFSCFHCEHTWEAVEVPSSTLRILLERSLRLAQLEQKNA